MPPLFLSRDASPPMQLQSCLQVEFPVPDRRQKRLIFGVCTSKMSLAEDVDLESFVARPDKLSGAEIASICLEAGMQAVRKNRFTRP